MPCGIALPLEDDVTTELKVTGVFTIELAGVVVKTTFVVEALTICVKLIEAGLEAKFVSPVVKVAVML